MRRFFSCLAAVILLDTCARNASADAAPAAAAPVVATRATTAPVPAASGSTAAARASSGARSTAPPETIQVTARLRTEDPQKVPVPLTVVTHELLELREITTPRQLNEVAPSLNLTQANPRQTIIGIRGIGGTTMVSDGLEDPVGVYLDGVYLGRPGEFAYNFFDLDQVDVLRGPQGTLYGRNTVAGAINIATNQPSFTPSAVAEADYGNYDLRQYHAEVDARLVDNQVAVRLTAYDTKRSGFLYDDRRDTAENANDGYGVRLQTLFVLAPDLHYTVAASYNRADEPQGEFQFLDNQPESRTGFSFSRSAALVAPGYTPPTSVYARIVDNDAQQFDNTHQFIMSGTGEWALAHGYKATSITAYQTWAFYPENDTDFTALPIGTNDNFIDHVNQFSQEFRLASPAGRDVDWVAGLYLYNQDLTGRSQSFQGTDAWAFNSTLAALANGTAARRTQLASTLNGLDYQTNEDPQTDSYAAFAQDSWHVAPRWTLTTGFRETYELRRQSDNGLALGNTQIIGCADSDIRCRFGGLTLTQSQAQKATNAFPLGDDVFASHENLFSGLATLSYQAGKHALLYATYSHGAQSSGLNVGPLNAQLIAQGATNVVAPENADNYEIGTKTTWLDGRLYSNLDVYWENVSDYQTNAIFLINGTARQALANAGSIRSRGAEFDGGYSLTRDIGITAGASYVDAIYTSFADAPCSPEETAAGRTVCSLTGAELANSPRWIANISPTYAHDFGRAGQIYGVGGYLFRSSQFLTTDDAAGGHIGGYGVFDLRVGWRFGARHQFDVSGFAHNLFDKQYLINIQENNGAFLAYPGDPRTVGASLRVSY